MRFQESSSVRLSVKIHHKDDVPFPLSTKWTYICCSVCIVYNSILTPPSILFHSTQLLSFPSYQFSPNHDNQTENQTIKDLWQSECQRCCSLLYKNFSASLYISFPWLTATNSLKKYMKKNLEREKTEICREFYISNFDSSHLISYILAYLIHSIFILACCSFSLHLFKGILHFPVSSQFIFMINFASLSCLVSTAYPLSIRCETSACI